MLSKEKVLNYLDVRIACLKQENDLANSLPDTSIGKAKFVEGSFRALDTLQEARAFINSDLAQE